MAAAVQNVGRHVKIEKADALKSSTESNSWPAWKIALGLGLGGSAAVFAIYYLRRRGKKKCSDQGDASSCKESKDISLQEERAIGDGAEDSDVKRTPLTKATAMKSEGNKLFKEGKYDQAINCYTNAINACPRDNAIDLATFYQNRAAAYEQLRNQNEVIADCSKALALNRQYTKALFRRAKAYEELKKFRQCLEDVTAVCIMEEFRNSNSVILADRVLKQLSKEQAVEAFKNWEYEMPSSQFICSYLTSFTEDPILVAMNQVEEKRLTSLENGVADEEEDDASQRGYPAALHCLSERKYDSILEMCQDELSAPPEKRGCHWADAMFLRGTFLVIYGRHDEAADCLNKIIDDEQVDVKIKQYAKLRKAEILFHLKQEDEALKTTTDIIQEAPDVGDFYFHRGQMHLLNNNAADAVQDFSKAVELMPGYHLAVIQKCFSEFKLACEQQSVMQLQAATNNFKTALNRFPKSAEGHMLYAQALADQEQFMESCKMYDKATQLDPENANILVHKAMMMLMWKQDMEAAIKLINKAIEVDNKCEYAYETLGMLNIQRGDVASSIKLIDKAIPLCRSLDELTHLYSLREASKAQMNATRNHDLSLPPPATRGLTGTSL